MGRAWSFGILSTITCFFTGIGWTLNLLENLKENDMSTPKKGRCWFRIFHNNTCTNVRCDKLVVNDAGCLVMMVETKIRQPVILTSYAPGFWDYVVEISLIGRYDWYSGEIKENYSPEDLV